MNQSLTDFFQKKTKQSESAPTIDWDERRNKYLAEVNALYDQIETMLEKPISGKHVGIFKRPKPLSETQIGTDSANDLILVIGTEQVRFSPRGRTLRGPSVALTSWVSATRRFCSSSRTLVGSSFNRDNPGYRSRLLTNRRLPRFFNE